MRIHNGHTIQNGIDASKQKRGFLAVEAESCCRARWQRGLLSMTCWLRFYFVGLLKESFKRGWDMVSFVLWKDLSAPREWIVVVCQRGVLEEAELSSSGLAQFQRGPWRVRVARLLGGSGEFGRRSGFGWSRGAVTGRIAELGAEASLCFLDSCRLASEERT